jgi:phosphoribosyl 1,2-cyclic phosphodiesterase
MRFASLGSGSRGNALLVEAGRTRVLIDCGFGPRELSARLGRLGLAPQDLDAILVTHEHSDHVGGVASCARRFGLAVYLTHGTRVGAAIDGVDLTVFDSHQSFALGDLEIHPYPVPHDAREPVQFVVGDGRLQLGVLTDAGCLTPHMVAMLDGSDGLVLEFNHDLGMLMAGNYPWRLKQRIASRLGHLDNRTAADLLGQIDRPRLQHVIAAHLSERNNSPGIVRAALADALACSPDEVAVADQQNGFDWRQLR